MNDHWESLLLKHLITEGKLQKAAIFGLTGALWASFGASADKIKPEEILALVKAFSDPFNAQKKGLKVSEEDYTLIGETAPMYHFKPVLR
jgi:hypothetical protein